MRCNVRLTGSLNCPSVYKEDYRFEIGKGIVLNEGKDIAVIASGTLVGEALKACQLLKEQGFHPTVVNMHTIKPLDTELVEKLTKNHSVIYTLEEHSVIGGLGGAVAESLAELGTAVKLVRLGFKDSYAKLGSYEYLLEQNGLDADGIVKSILERK